MDNDSIIELAEFNSNLYKTASDSKENLIDVSIGINYLVK